MAEAAHPRGSAVIGAGSYRVERRRIILHTPAAIRIEDPPPEDPAELEAARRAALEREAVEAGPTPQELAEREAQAIVAAARDEADGLRALAREEGHAEGLKAGNEEGREAGREEGLRELREALDRWLTMGDALVEAWRARFEGLEGEVKDLAVAAAERLVAGSLAASPEAVTAVVRDALRHAAEADLVTVLVSPKDAGLVRTAKEELAGSLKGTGRFEIVEDPKIEAGGCLVETRTQVIDATRKTRLEGLRGAMEPR